MLTGVIDSPETFSVIKSLFARVFVWVILKYKMKKTNNLTIQESVHLDLEKQVVNTNTNPNPPVNSMLFSDVLKAKSQIVPQEKVTNNIVLSEWSDDEEETDVLGSDSNQNRQSSNISFQSNQIKILNKSIDEKIESNIESQSINSLENLSKRLSISDNINVSKNIGIPQNSSDSNTGNRVSSSDTISTDRLLQTDNSLSVCYTSLMPKDEWLSAFFDFTYRRRINHSLYQFMFSDDWFKIVINTICDNSLQLKDSEITSLIDSYKQIVLVCFSCILRNNEMSSQTIHQIFNGIFNDGFNNQFFDLNQELYEITVKSFQYSLKLAIDQILLGNDTQTHNELIESLIDYDMNWFIGDDTSIEWKNSVIAEKRNLFSIGRDPIKVLRKILRRL